jgi:hypothetical protein
MASISASVRCLMRLPPGAMITTPRFGGNFFSAFGAHFVVSVTAFYHQSFEHGPILRETRRDMEFRVHERRQALERAEKGLALGSPHLRVRVNTDFEFRTQFSNVNLGQEVCSVLSIAAQGPNDFEIQKRVGVNTLRHAFEEFGRCPPTDVLTALE